MYNLVNSPGLSPGNRHLMLVKKLVKTLWVATLIVIRVLSAKPDFRTNSVSYTHLDVYKRQDCICTDS